jgi:hypothetical protein
MALEYHCLFTPHFVYWKVLFSIYYIPGTVLGATGMVLNITKSLNSRCVHSGEVRKTRNKQRVSGMDKVWSIEINEAE